MRQPAQEVGKMRRLILAAFAALTLITTIVPVSFAGPRDTTGSSSPKEDRGLMGGGG